METPKRNLHLANVQGTTTPLRIPASPFLKSLGFGTGVNVYCLERSPKNTGQPRSPWALKRVSKRIIVTNTENSKVLNDRIVKEAEILRKLEHPNIVGFRAIAQEKDGVDTLALECCKTSLGMILEQRFEEDLNSLPAQHIKRMIIDISSALDYLHTEAKLLHGDIKSHNILVKGDFEICKLCDFGVSLPLNAEGVINFKENPKLEYVGTELWCAPEVINEEDIIDPKAEIFSFGLVIYETIALVPPHTLNSNDSENSELLSNENESALNTESDNDENSENHSFMEFSYGTRPALPQAFNLSDEYNIIVELFYLCTNSSPEERPTAKVIHNSIK